MTVVFTTVMTIAYGCDNDDSGIKEENNNKHIWSYDDPCCTEEGTKMLRLKPTTSLRRCPSSTSLRGMQSSVRYYQHGFDHGT